MAQADVVAVTKYSKTPDLAWKLLKAITSKEAGISVQVVNHLGIFGIVLFRTIRVRVEKLH